MKGFVKFLCSGLLVLLVLIGTGNAVFAHEGGENEEDCGCPFIYLDGAERNKLVANILKSTDFHNLKKAQEAEGYSFAGADLIQVVKPNTGEDFRLGAVPFVNEKGEIKYAAFYNNSFAGFPPGPTPF
ncbi:hypothetical protein [Fredinandcohnia sp. 179-A 10B2 NHS]|uniref:hypothetical protein n=1 Tax=Fredinandcohnia sp. 179-A 10B2 NHS TaxID=3235176 RepID=UPI0039A27A6E